jgi:CheY-like chemotaxis protein
VRNGREVIDVWRTDHWDSVLMDVQMPIIDGMTATRAIRKLASVIGRGRTPIIGLTANVMPHQTQEYIAAGMDACVAKPIEVGVLFDALEHALSGVAYRDESAVGGGLNTP